MSSTIVCSYDRLSQLLVHTKSVVASRALVCLLVVGSHVSGTRYSSVGSVNGESVSSVTDTTDELLEVMGELCEKSLFRGLFHVLSCTH
jgi:hypothetical protein